MILPLVPTTGMQGDGIDKEEREKRDAIYMTQTKRLE